MRVAMMQASPGDSVQHTTQRLRLCAEQAAAEAVDVLVTPEMYLTGYNIGATACRAAAEPLDGPLITSVASVARETGVALLVGFPELGLDDKVYNAVALVDARGQTLSSYRKTHLWGELDRSQFSAGDGFAEPVELAGSMVALAICFDIEFPEVTRTLALMGATVILVPTANWLEAVNNRLVPARAQENGVSLVYVNYWGTEGSLDYCGQSVAADPYGEILANAGTGDSMTIVDLSIEVTAAARAEIDYLSARRPELYRDGS